MASNPTITHGPVQFSSLACLRVPTLTRGVARCCSCDMPRIHADIREHVMAPQRYLSFTLGLHGSTMPMTVPIRSRGKIRRWQFQPRLEVRVWKGFRYVAQRCRCGAANQFRARSIGEFRCTPYVAVPSALGPSWRSIPECLIRLGRHTPLR